MTVALTIFYLLVVLAYGTTTIFYLSFFLREDERFLTRARIPRGAGKIFHLIFLILLGFKYKELPLVGASSFLSLLALTLVIVHTVQELRLKVGGTGVFVMGIATLLQIVAYPAIHAQPEIKELFQSPGFGIHVFLALAGYTGFILSALYAVLYLVMFRQLKAKRFGLFFRNLPPLDLLAKLNIDAALVGWIALTPAILLGIGMSIRLDMDLLWDPKTLHSFVAWVVYLALLIGHRKMQWPGRTLARISLICFVLFLLSMGILMALLQTKHQFA
ncbi:cytochrome c biogenesis protein CcsA [bacterium]|nr:cytochrome c biogenesis protein CcsA [bacterium]